MQNQECGGETQKKVVFLKMTLREAKIFFEKFVKAVENAIYREDERSLYTPKFPFSQAVFIDGGVVKVKYDSSFPFYFSNLEKLIEKEKEKIISKNEGEEIIKNFTWNRGSSKEQEQELLKGLD